LRWQFNDAVCQARFLNKGFNSRDQAHYGNARIDEASSDLLEQRNGKDKIAERGNSQHSDVLRGRISGLNGWYCFARRLFQSTGILDSHVVEEAVTLLYAFNSTQIKQYRGALYTSDLSCSERRLELLPGSESHQSFFIHSRLIAPFATSAVPTNLLHDLLARRVASLFGETFRILCRQPKAQISRRATMS
jgi:hypothetical protein